MTTFLSGYKTYLAVAVLALAGIGKILGVDVPGFENMDVGAILANALAVLGLRAALAKSGA